MKWLAALLSGIPVPVFLAFSQTPPASHQDHIPRDYRMTPMSTPPHKIEGIGSSHLKITTKSPEAQAWFDYGLKLFHAFYHDDAKLAFDKAAERDPDCAMCLWGQALSRGATQNYDDRRSR